MLDDINAAALWWPDADAADTRAGDSAARPAQRINAPPADNDLELPPWIWRVMFAAYGLFFAGLLWGTGHDREALFAIVISALYLPMYFVTGGLLVGLNPAARRSDFARGVAPLQTATGPMSTLAVAGQVLIIPVSIALFGVGIGIVRASLG